MPESVAGILPDDLLLDRIDFQDARTAVDAQRHRRIAALALIVEHDQIARARQARLDQMGVMLAADLVDAARGTSGATAWTAEIRPQRPDNMPALAVDDGNEIGVAGIEQDIVRRETLVARIEPFVRAERRHVVDMQIIGRLHLAQQFQLLPA